MQKIVIPVNPGSMMFRAGAGTQAERGCRIKSGMTTLAYFAAGLIIGLALTSAAASAAILHVRPDGDDANPGTSWAAAKKTVQAAINAANANDQIWVAAGTYEEHIKNKTVNNEAVAVAIYGGFAGDEGSLSQRNYLTNKSILDGGGGAYPAPPATGSVITITGGAGNDTLIDGFTIVRGHAYFGGGITVIGSAPIIRNNIIRDNDAGAGAGIFVSDYKITEPKAFPVITLNAITNNASGDGGGIAVVGSEYIVQLPSSAPLISWNFISRNTADFDGGGIGCWGHASPVILNNRIIANTANFEELSGGAGGGGVFATKNDLEGRPVQFGKCAPTIANNIVSANGALHGGGICIIDYPQLIPDLPAPVVTNNTIAANHGAGIFWANTFPVITNNLVAYNTWGLERDAIGMTSETTRHNCVYGNTLQGNPTNYKGIADQSGQNGNLSADPRPANIEIGNYHLQPNSPCVNAGLTTAADPTWFDMDGNPRIAAGAVDIGAYESKGNFYNVPTPVVYVRPNGSDESDGSSWAQAKRTVAGGISRAYQLEGAEIWVVAGIYNEHVSIPAFVYLYGGFAGNETTRGGRNFNSNISILDGGGIPIVAALEKSGYLASTLDGFTIQNGGTFTNGVLPGGNAGHGGRGGGIYNRVSSAKIANNVIRRNSLGNPFDNANKLAYGGGYYGYLSYSEISNNQFIENEVVNTFDGSGGGVYCILSMPTIRGNSFWSNIGRYGAAIYTEFSSPLIVGNTIDANRFYPGPQPTYMGAVDGAITLSAGDYFRIEDNIITRNQADTGAGINVRTNLAGRIQNNLILNNKAYEPSSLGDLVGLGGGIYCMLRSDAVEHTFILNNTIVGNTASDALGIFEQGGGIALSLPPTIPPVIPPPPAKLTIANNIIAFNSSGIFQTLTSPMLIPTLLANDVFNTKANYINLSKGTTDFSLDPRFIDRDGADNNPSTIEDNDYHLATDSPCIDAGNGSIQGLPVTDLDGNKRIIDGNHDGTAKIDLGAYEFGQCFGEMDGDDDVDGKDLALFIEAYPSGLSLGTFAACFGRDDCQ
jgi:hypothetical protein